MTSEEEIDILLRAAYPIICVLSYEERRVEASIINSVKKRFLGAGGGSPIYYWSCTEGMVDFDNGRRDDDVTSPIEILEKVGSSAEPAVFILRDFHEFMGEGSTVVQRKLKDLSYYLTEVARNRHIIIVGHHFEIPPSLEKILAVVDFNLPTEKELLNLIKETMIMVDLEEDWKKLEEDPQALDRAVHATKGLTLVEAENVLTKSIVSTGGLDVRTILGEKKHIIKKSGVLEYYESDASMDSVGGLETLKEWLLQRGNAFSPSARDYGLPNPKGVLIVGIPGTGKSLISKAIGIAWSMPVLKMDIGALFGSLVGQSEANMRKALKTAEALAPCVLWVNRPTLNYVNCWDALRATTTTTWLATTSVNVQKRCGLGNQQPRLQRYWSKVQRPSL